jgi:hypothetical protein
MKKWLLHFDLNSQVIHIFYVGYVYLKRRISISQYNFGIYEAVL